MAFISLWIGLEALVLKALNTDHKKRKMQSRLGSLARAHANDVQLEDVVGHIWNIRSKTLHEGFGAGVDALEQDVTAEVLNVTRYLFLISVMYALEQNQSVCSFDHLWSGVSSYSPSVRVRVEDIPHVTDVIEVFRH